MPQTIQAVYEHGVFIPRSPVILPEHTAVTVRLPSTVGQSGKHRAASLLQEPGPAERFLALGGITKGVSKMSSVELQKSSRREWRGL